MTLNLSKGGNISLAKESPGLTAVSIGLGWDARSTTGRAFDLDASAILVGADGKVLSDGHFVFFNNMTSVDGSVKHLGDNRTGSGDAEVIDVDLAIVPVEVHRIVFATSVYDGETRRQNFGQVRTAYIRVVNKDDGEELVRYDLSEDSSTETAVVFGELYRTGTDWQFRAIGQGYADGLAGIVRDHGVSID